MTSYSALGPVSIGVYAALNVAGLTALATGGVYDHIPQATLFPCVRFSVEADPQSLSALGTKAGSGQLSEIDLRVHVYSIYEGANEAHAIIDKVVELLRNPPTVALHSSWDIVNGTAIELHGGDVIAGVRVNEWMVPFLLRVEQTG